VTPIHYPGVQRTDEQRQPSGIEEGACPFGNIEINQLYRAVQAEFSDHGADDQQ